MDILKFKLVFFNIYNLIETPFKIIKMPKRNEMCYHILCCSVIVFIGNLFCGDVRSKVNQFVTTYYYRA